MKPWPWPTPCTLYGMPVSLYSGKARSYLRKQGIPYVERLLVDPGYQTRILPVLRRIIVPVVELPDGTIVQDTTDIIDHFEAAGLARLPCYPATPRQRLVALTAELFGDEGLLRLAMHFRWSFLADNETYIRREFGSFMAPTASAEEQDARAQLPMLQMQSYVPRLGISAETAPLIEAAYDELLDILEAHFRQHPYLLGGRPSIGDYGLLASLYAHLGRDPYPTHIMRRRAPRVARWVERMNACDPDMPEYPDAVPDAFLPDDAVPETLLPLLAFIARDHLPEIGALVRFVDDWPDAATADPGTPISTRPERRAVGRMRFVYRGREIETAAVPYTLYMLQRVTDAFAALSAADKAAVTALFDAAGLAGILTLTARRRVARVGHIEVWGERAPV